MEYHIQSRYTEKNVFQLERESLSLKLTEEG